MLHANTSPKDAEKRGSYRVRYPMELRPQLTLGGEAAAIVDISESGLRFLRPRGPCGVGETLRGVVQLRCGTVAQISGRVVRLAGAEAAVRLEPGISFSTILREQRELRAHQRYSH